jgi:NTP pyrophosphatase (non-canonical NTP hydrolase)
MSLPDNKTTVQTLKDLIVNFGNERNWQPYQKPRDLAISISLEAAELLELFQWYGKNDEESLKTDGKLPLLEEELADVLIYCIQMAHTMDIGISDAIVRKLEKNAVKYPVVESGGTT